MKTTVIILAAGQGTRMRSSLPKVLHPVAGQPLIRHLYQTVSEISSEKPVVIIGHAADKVRQEMGEDVFFAVQEEQLGTGHAVKAAEQTLKGKTDLILVVSADMPLLTSETLQEMLSEQISNQGPVTMLSVISENPRGFGRVVRSAEGNVKAIVEEAQASPQELQINELNVGAYCFRASWLWGALKRIRMSPKGEYYLTDVVEIAVSEGENVGIIQVSNIEETIGINNRVHLAEAQKILQKRINEYWMLEGVTILDPQTTYIEKSVSIGRDSLIYPNTHLVGDTRIGEDCQIGPNTYIFSSDIGDGCRVFMSVLEKAKMDKAAEIGPFGHLRKGAHLGERVHMGNFGEVKNSYLGPDTKMGHFSYLGDATIGTNVNIGAGTITCNFDGENKHSTEIGDDVFIGSDTMLVAPLKIEKNARTGAGSVVTKDVPAGSTVVGVPARSFKKKKD